MPENGKESHMSKKLEIISEITAESLVLNVENATVRIVHSWDAKAITVKANNPEHWLVVDDDQKALVFAA